MPDARSRARGMLLGLAVGDALGRPVEGLSRQEVQERFGALDDFRDSFSEAQAAQMAARLKRNDFDRALRFWKKRGVYSDDTQQAILLAYLLGKNGDISGHDAAEEYLRIAGIPIMGPYFGAFRGTSDGFRTSVLAYRKSHDWRQCGVASPGNSAAARIAPVGFFYRSDLDTLFWRVVEVSLVTHRDTRALAGAYVMGWLTAKLAVAEGWPGLALLDEAVEATRAAEERMVREYAEDLLVGPERKNDFSYVLGKARDALKADPRTATEAILQGARERSVERITSPTDGVAMASVVTAVLLALSQGGASFEGVVAKAVGLGGDADTVGAMVGALCGAYHGMEGVPARWQDSLENAEGILRYGDALTAPRQGDLPDPLDAESRLCADEEGARQAMAAKLLKGR